MHATLRLSWDISPESSHVIAQNPQGSILPGLFVLFTPLGTKIFAHMPQSEHKHRQRQQRHFLPTHRPIEHQERIGNIDKGSRQPQKGKPINFGRMDVRCEIGQHHRYCHNKGNSIKQPIEESHHSDTPFGPSLSRFYHCCYNFFITLSSSVYLLLHIRSWLIVLHLQIAQAANRSSHLH